MQNSVVSVVIPCKNSAGTLRLCLESIISQTYPNLEIIVADSSSNDATQAIAEGYSAKVMRFPGNYERTQKKNEAALRSNGQFIHFVDSDVELTPTVIEDCVRVCLQGASAVIIPFRFRGRDTFWDRCRELEAVTYDDDRLVSSPSFFLKSAFAACHGYDNQLIFGEENDLHIRLIHGDYKIGKISSVFYHHEGSFQSVVRRKYYYGKTSLAYISKQGSVGLARFSFIRVGWIRNRRLLLSDPSHAVGLLILKWTEYLAAGIGLLVSVTYRLRNKTSSNLTKT